MNNVVELKSESESDGAKGRKSKPKSIEERLCKLEGDFTHAIIRLEKNEKLLKKAVCRLKRFEPTQVERELEVLALRSSDLTHRFQAMIARITVCTEIAYAAKTLKVGSQSILPNLIELFDKPDEFWLKAEQRTIGAWLSELTRAK